MKPFSFFLLLILAPLSLFAEEDFHIYKKPLLPGIYITQTDTHTELIYKWKMIKKYVNTEFAIELLPHGPEEMPDCYNSLSKSIPSTRAKNIIGKDYLRSCLVLQTLLIRNRFILFYGPSVDGNRVSVYDIRTGRFAHWVANNVIGVKSTIRGEIVFFVRNLWSTCQRSLYLYKDGISKSVFDECSLEATGGPLIQIHGYRVTPGKLRVDYTPYRIEATGDYVLDMKMRSNIALSL